MMFCNIRSFQRIASLSRPFKVIESPLRGTENQNTSYRYKYRYGYGSVYEEIHV